MWKMSEKEKRIIAQAERTGKEFYYVGHYIDADGNYVLKPGTTNDLQRRRTQHNSAYRKTPNHPMMPGTEFVYDWFIPLSKYNTLRVEDRMKDFFQEQGFGEYLNNDRFIFAVKPAEVRITIRKTYVIKL